MRGFACVLASLVVLSPSLAVSQQSPSPTPSGGLDLLKRVEQRYAGAKSYSLAFTQEMTQTGKYQRIWNKTVAAAMEAPGGLYRFEGQANMGGAIRISDGKTVWTYHIGENQYTAKPASAVATKTRDIFSPSESGLSIARNQRYILAHLTHSVRSASMLPEETLNFQGKSVRCFVVRIRDSDLERPDPLEQFDEEIWIDAQKQTVMRMATRRKHAAASTMPAFTQVNTTTFTKTMLDEPIPGRDFTFVPPAGAVQVAAFPNPMDGPFTMTGDIIPALQLKTADGKTVPIESFRGKPVLIDFWATWCAPCVAEMPKLAEIYKEGKDNGLILISIDQDEDAAKANTFLASHGYDWPNFHDGDAAIRKLMGDSALPRTLLVDAKGKIVYDRMGEDENRLRTQLAELGPEFHDLGPKPQQPAPCVAGK